MSQTFGPGWSSTKIVVTEDADRPGLKVGRVGDHVVYCDEPPSAGGKDEHPSPLGYLGLAVGWCLLAQIERYSAMLRVEIEHASCTVEMDFNLTGSVRRGTVQAGCSAVRTHLSVRSSADVASVIEVVATARRGCFVEQVISGSVTVVCDLELNGQPVPLDEAASGASNEG